jgi:hypothetical protein
MKADVRADFEWQAQYEAQVRGIIGAHLVLQAPLKLDMTQATDFMVLKSGPTCFACRLRRPGYYRAFPGQFTLRNWRMTGARTEYQKIIEDKFGDWMLYGHVITER